MKIPDSLYLKFLREIIRIYQSFVDVFTSSEPPSIIHSPPQLILQKKVSHTYEDEYVLVFQIFHSVDEIAKAQGYCESAEEIKSLPTHWTNILHRAWKFTDNESYLKITKYVESIFIKTKFENKTTLASTTFLNRKRTLLYLWRKCKITGTPNFSYRTDNDISAYCVCLLVQNQNIKDI